MTDLLGLIQQVLSYYEGDVTLSMLVYIVIYLIGFIFPATQP